MHFVQWKYWEVIPMALYINFHFSRRSMLFDTIALFLTVTCDRKVRSEKYCTIQLSSSNWTILYRFWNIRMTFEIWPPDPGTWVRSWKCRKKPQNRVIQVEYSQELLKIWSKTFLKFLVRLVSIISETLFYLFFHAYNLLNPNLKPRMNKEPTYLIKRN